MQGKATLTLSEASTGRVVKQLTEHNMVTDAVSRILKPPEYTMINGFDYTDFLKSVLPVYNYVMGGVMLLGNELEERPDNVYIDKNSVIVGTAGSAYSGADVLRGSLNLNETYKTDDGYHFTWDFGTDKANGTIKCIALTSRMFGDTGTPENKTGYYFINPTKMSEHNGFTTKVANAYGQFVGMFQEKTAVYIKSEQLSENVIFVKVKCLDPQSIGIHDVPGFTEAQEPFFSKTVTFPFKVLTQIRWFYDNDKDWLHFFSSVVYLKDSDTYVVQYTAIDTDNFEIQEQGSYTLASANYYIYAAAFYDGKFFITSSDGIDIYSEPGVISKHYSCSRGSTSMFYVVNGVLNYYENQYVYQYNDGDFRKIYSQTTHSYRPAVDIPLPYALAADHTTSISVDSKTMMNPYLVLMPAYFATINNLSEPIVKTNQLTLKVCYDITH